MAERRLRLLEDLRAVEIYTAVVETNSISRAAHRLGIFPSTVSKKVGELEERARTRLLHRSTRRISLTEAGHRFYEQCVRLLNEAERAEWDLRDDAREPSGRIRVAAPVVFSQRQIAPILPDFLRRYPDIEVELFTSARTLNIVEEGFDLSIRLARADQVARHTRVLASNRRVVCAAPDYVARHGELKAPADLDQHNCLIAMTGQRADVWRFQGKTGIEAIRVRGQLASDNASVLAEAAVRGMGIALLGTFAVGDHLNSGALIEVLPGILVQDSVVTGVLPERAYVPHRVNLFLDFLANAFGSPPMWDRNISTQASPKRKALKASRRSQRYPP
jgi:DNA-binding transcriptional LysR family regulator